MRNSCWVLNDILNKKTPALLLEFFCLIMQDDIILKTIALCILPMAILHCPLLALVYLQRNG